MPNEQDQNTTWQGFKRWLSIPPGMTLQSYAVVFLITAFLFCLYLLGARVVTPDQANQLIDKAILAFAIVIVVIALYHGDGGKPAGLGPWKPLP